MADTLKSLTEGFRNVGVSRAYGDRIRLGGKEVVPIALVSFGFGGGTEGGEPEGTPGAALAAHFDRKSLRDVVGDVPVGQVGQQGPFRIARVFLEVAQQAGAHVGAGGNRR